MILSPRKTYKINFEHENCNEKKYPQLVVKELTFTSEELLHSIITCGMPKYYLTSSNLNNRYNEILYKISIIECSLDEEIDPADPTKTTGYLSLSDKLKYLDSSERAVISYYIGMFITKLISKKIFNVQYLVHLSIAELNNTITFTSKNRPDLIGYSFFTNEYSVFEAKGRKNFIKKTIDDAYTQLMSVDRISGSIPSIKVANMTYFKNGILNSYIKDPEETGELSFDFSPETVLKQYYKPIYELLDENSQKFNKNTSDITINLPNKHVLTVTIAPIVKSLFIENVLDKNAFSIVKEHINKNNPTNDFISVTYE